MTTPAGIPGDPFSGIKEDKKDPLGVTGAREVERFHTKDDVDSSIRAHHHTSGSKHNQHSPGDHNHAGGISPKIGNGANLSVTGAKAGNVALANLLTMLAKVIDFTDTTT